MPKATDAERVLLEQAVTREYARYLGKMVLVHTATVRGMNNSEVNIDLRSKPLRAYVVDTPLRLLNRWDDTSQWIDPLWNVYFITTNGIGNLVPQIHATSMEPGQCMMGWYTPRPRWWWRIRRSGWMLYVSGRNQWRKLFGKRK